MVKKFLSLTALISVIATGIGWAQSGAHAVRDMFLKTAGSSTQGPAVLGLRYAVVRLTPGNSFEEVSPETVFRAKDEVRLKITSNQPGYLYIVQQGSSGAWRLLLPDPDIDNGNNLMPGGRPFEIPGGPGESFIIDNQPGREHLFVLLARKPVADLNQVIGALRAGHAARANDAGVSEKPVVSQNVMEKLLASTRRREIIEDTIDAPNKEAAVYVMNKVASPEVDDRIMVDFSLIHR